MLVNVRAVVSSNYAHSHRFDSSSLVWNLHNLTSSWLSFHMMSSLIQRSVKDNIECWSKLNRWSRLCCWQPCELMRRSNLTELHAKKRNFFPTNLETHSHGLAWLCARSGLILTVGCWHYITVIILKSQQESASHSLPSLVPMVHSQLANKRCWHQSYIVMTEEGKLQVTWQKAQHRPSRCC